MALYERYDTEGRKVERAFTVDGDPRDVELAGKAAAGVEGWERAGEAEQGADKLPARSASKADWRAYAVAHGMAEADADSATRDQLADKYHDDPKE